MPEVGEEGRLVELRRARGNCRNRGEKISASSSSKREESKARLTSLVPVRLDVPVGVNVVDVVLLVARDLDLLESPLRENSVGRSNVASRVLMSEPQSSRQRVDLLDVLLLSLSRIVDDLDDPVVVRVSDGSVPVARDLVVELADGSGDGMRVEVSSCRSVNESNDVVVLEESEVAGIGERLGFPGRSDDPLVVVVLVVVAGDLLLVRTDGVGLDVRVKKPSSVSDVFEGELRSVGSLCRTRRERSQKVSYLKGGVEEERTKRVLSEVVSVEVGLEERAHLRVSRTRVSEDEEVKLEAEEVDG